MLAHRMFMSYTPLLSRGISSFKFADLSIETTKSPKPKPDWETLQFGHTFSDHMFSVDYHTETGWAKPRIHPLENFSLHPGCQVFHYAIELFEGLKAYHCVDGKIRMFRPDENMKRMNKSCSRAALPNFDGDELVKCMKSLIHLDRDWVPKQRGKSLYIRPTVIGIDPMLGISPPNQARLYVLLGPVGPYFPTGVKPVSLLADASLVRAWPGGAGDCKLGANYAPTVKVQKDASVKGYQQILWLFGDDHRITEVGTMNLFVYWKNEKGETELITPPLNGTILGGITRLSILEMTKTWDGVKVLENEMTMKQLLKGLSEGRVMEMFGAGTACVVCPVEKIHYEGKDYEIPTMTQGAPFTMKVLKELTDIQYGVQGSHPWTQLVIG